MKKARAGFTIVELLVVIAVIGILASITIVSYNRAQLNARDTAIKNAAAQTADALQLWATRNNTTPDNTNIQGAANNGRGWVQTSKYATTIEDVLVTSGYLPNGFSANLQSATPDYATQTLKNRSILMFYNCGTTGKYAVYAALNDDDAGKKAEEKAKADAASCPTTTQFNSHRMNYVVIF